MPFNNSLQGADLKRLLEIFDSPAIKAVTTLSPDWPDRHQKLVNDLRRHLWRQGDGVDRPMRVVIVGPTGSGKSTLLNGLVGQAVTRAGSVRPTTTWPLVYVQRQHASQMAEDPLRYEVVSGLAPILDDICLVDTPDIDSTNLANHQLAASALDMADVVIFVASALRYADMVPWKVLRGLESRGVPVIHVLNRVSSDSSGVVTDFRRLLRREKMSGGEVIRVSEHRLADQGILPDAAVRVLRRALLDRVDERGQESELMMRASLEDLNSRARAFFEELDRGLESRAGLHRRLHLDLSVLDTTPLAEPVDDWSRQLQVDRRRNRVTVRSLRRRGLDGDVCERIGSQIRAELMSCLEKSVALFDLDDDNGLVLDLRPQTPETRKPIAGILDGAVDRWFYRPGVGAGDTELTSYQNALRAVVALRASQKRIDSEPEPSLREMMSDVVRELAGLAGRIDVAAARSALDAGRAILKDISPSPALLNA